LPNRRKNEYGATIKKIELVPLMLSAGKYTKPETNGLTFTADGKTKWLALRSKNHSR
jgi:cobalamin biosynthesis Co2+ chelatase CbiK